MYLTEEIWRKLLLFHRGSHGLSSCNRSCPGCCCPARHRRRFFCEERRHIREMRFSTKPARSHLRLLSGVIFCKWLDIAQMLSVLDDHVHDDHVHGAFKTVFETSFFFFFCKAAFSMQQFSYFIFKNLTRWLCKANSAFVFYLTCATACAG